MNESSSHRKSSIEPVGRGVNDRFNFNIYNEHER